jgi:predicted nucleic acid-binding protein
MSAAKPPRQFVDSNILVYSFDLQSGEKSRKARELLDELWKQRVGCLSFQVLQEFFVSVTARLQAPLSAPEATRKVADFSEWTLHRPDKSDLFAAIELHQELRVSFWDAMIIQSARRLGCRILWTEDLNNGQVYAGVMVRDPFVELVMEEETSAYENAKEQALQHLRNPPDPGTFGEISWTRDELHERRPEKKTK